MIQGIERHTWIHQQYKHERAIMLQRQAQSNCGGCDGEDVKLIAKFSKAVRDADAKVLSKKSTSR